MTPIKSKATLKCGWIVLFFAILGSGCRSNFNEIAASPDSLISRYYASINNSDFEEIDKLISDSLLVMERDQVLSSNKGEYQIQFHWDSVFHPSYEILELDSIDIHSVELIVSKTCQRIKFLHDIPIIVQQRVEFQNNQICKLITTDYEVFDFEKWNGRRDSLTQWIDREHPELSGFQFDLTPKGAQTYLKAIELYRTR